MQSFFCQSENIIKSKAIIKDKRQLHHMRNVLRLKPQDTVLIWDEKRNAYKAAVHAVSSSQIELLILEKRAPHTAAGAAITVACAIPKGPRMDGIIDSLTQLGVQRIVPLLTRRVIVKLDERKKITRGLRWEKIALQASQQSKRTAPPVIYFVKELADFLREAPDFDLRLIPTLQETGLSIHEAVNKTQVFKNASVLIGPEGDFTPEEVALAASYGFTPVTLGEFVLRVDTAAVAIAGYLKFSTLPKHAHG